MGFLNEVFKCRQIGFPKITRVDVLGIETVTVPFRTGVYGIVLGAGMQLVILLPLTISDEDLALLNERASVSADGDMAIVIAPTNDAVSAINESMLDSLDEPLYVYESAIEGSIGESAFPVPAKLELKVGARVMMLRNDSNSTSMKPEEGRRWANGTLGQVSKLTEDFIWVMVNGVSHQINRASWKKLQYEYDVRSKRLKQREVADQKL